MTNPRLLPLAVMATSLAVAAGCGEGDKSEAFAGKAERTCKQARTRFKDAGSDRQRLLSAADETVRQLRAVQATGEDSDTWKRYVDKQQQYYADFRAAIKANDEKAIDRLDTTLGDEEARELGLTACIG